MMHTNFSLNILPSFNLISVLIIALKLMFTKMAATMKKTAAEDVNITFEDQQKIKKFAQNTSRITELKEEIEVKKVLKLDVI